MGRNVMKWLVCRRHGQRHEMVSAEGRDTLSGNQSR